MISCGCWMRSANARRSSSAIRSAATSPSPSPGSIRTGCGVSAWFIRLRCPTRRKRRPAATKRRSGCLRKARRPFVNELAPKLFAAENRERMPDKVARTAAIGLGVSPAGAAATALGMKARPDRSGVVRSASVPVLLVAGEGDAVVAPERTFIDAEGPNVRRVSLLGRLRAYVDDGSAREAGGSDRRFHGMGHIGTSMTPAGCAAEGRQHVPAGLHHAHDRAGGGSGRHHSRLAPQTRARQALRFIDDWLERHLRLRLDLADRLSADDLAQLHTTAGVPDAGAIIAVARLLREAAAVADAGGDEELAYRRRLKALELNLRVSAEKPDDAALDPDEEAEALLAELAAWELPPSLTLGLAHWCERRGRLRRSGELAVRMAGVGRGGSENGRRVLQEAAEASGRTARRRRSAARRSGSRAGGVGCGGKRDGQGRIRLKKCRISR